jgi:hypothetical protein
MPHEYTRQRQGRDFSLHETLMRALAESRMDSENAQSGEEAKKTLLQRLEHHKKEAERNAVPIDGYEPPEKRGLVK